MAPYFEGYQLITWWWVVFVLSVFILAIRIYIDRLGLRKVAPFRDVALVFALVIQLGCCVLQSITNDWDGYNLNGFDHHPEREVALLKMGWANILISYTMGTIFKADLLFLYHDLAPRKYHPRFFWMIMVGWFLVAANWIITVFWEFSVCRPLHLVWTPGSNCMAGPSYLYLVWNTHLLSEIFLYIIPIVIIARLKNWNFHQKLAAASMFFVGMINILCIVASITVQVYQRFDHSISFTTWAQLYTFSQFQSGIQRLTAILVLCMPQIKQFYRLIQDKVSKDGRKGSTTPTEGSDDNKPVNRWKKPRVGKEVPVNINVSTLGVMSKIRSLGGSRLGHGGGGHNLASHNDASTHSDSTFDRSDSTFDRSDGLEKGVTISSTGDHSD